MSKGVVALILLSACPFFLDAQSFFALRRERNLIATFGLNSSTYYGDLKDNSDIIDVKPSLSLGLMYYMGSRVAIRGEFSWVTLSGDDSESETEGKVQRNLSFTSSNFEIAATGVLHLFPNGIRFYQRPRFNPYVFGGIGYMFFSPKAEYQGEKYALAPLETEGESYSTSTLVIPYGIGAKLMVNPFINIGIEAGWRKTFSDYIDDVSTVYLDNNSFADPIAKALADRRPEIGLEPFAAGSKRGDPSNDDGYMLLSLKVEYYLPFKVGSATQQKLYNRKRKAYYRRPNARMP